MVLSLIENYSLQNLLRSVKRCSHYVCESICVQGMFQIQQPQWLLNLLQWDPSFIVGGYCWLWKLYPSTCQQLLFLILPRWIHNLLIPWTGLWSLRLVAGRLDHENRWYWIKFNSSTEFPVPYLNIDFILQGREFTRPCIELYRPYLASISIGSNDSHFLKA